jgi:hypothetical protein
MSIYLYRGDCVYISTWYLKVLLSNTRFELIRTKDKMLINVKYLKIEETKKDSYNMKFCYIQHHL